MPELDATATQTITARLAAAGSRRAELEQLLNAAGQDASADDYRRLILSENVAGKASAISRSKLEQQLRFRYCLDPAVPEFRAFRTLVREASGSDRGLICHLMFARTEKLYRETSGWIINRYSPGAVIATVEVSDWLATRLQAEGIHWSRETLDHVRQHVLSSLKDFGVLEGSQRKHRGTIAVSAMVASFAARLAQLEGLTPRQTLSSVWFRLLGVDEHAVEDALRDAHRAGLLSFRVQAQVVELVLPPLTAA